MIYVTKNIYAGSVAAISGYAGVKRRSWCKGVANSASLDGVKRNPGIENHHDQIYKKI